MAVASDLPRIEGLDVRRAELRRDRRPRRATSSATLTGNENRMLVKSGEIAPVDEARDRRHRGPALLHQQGVDLRGIGRALYQDVIAGSAVQGGSTIAQQLVKNRLEAQNDRTLFQKVARGGASPST